MCSLFPKEIFYIFMQQFIPILNGKISKRREPAYYFTIGKYHSLIPDCVTIALSYFSQSKSVSIFLTSPLKHMLWVITRSTYHIYPKYWDTLSTYHTCPNIGYRPLYHLLTCLSMLVCMENSVDPDQMPHSEASDLGLHCLQRTICPNT